MKYLGRDLLLFLLWKIDEVVVLGPDQEGDGRLVEPTPLPIPFLDGVQCAFARQIEHEQDRYCVVAD